MEASPRRGVRLLGAVDLGVPVPTRAAELVGYLVVHRSDAVPRDRVAAALWPDRAPAQARTNLRRTLHLLRSRWPPAAELAAGDTLVWPETLTADVIAFEEAAAEAARATSPHARCALLERAVAHYGGELLPTCSSEWVAGPRHGLAQLYCEMLEALATALLETDAPSQAMTVAERLVAADPVREEGYRLLMRALARRGEHGRVVETYRRCERALAELGVGPSLVTRSLRAELLLPEAVPAAEPADPGPLVGRTAEWAELVRTWRRVCAGRPAVALIAGQAGIGKTRLARDFARAVSSQAAVAWATAYRTGAATPYLPLDGWLRQLGGSTSGGASEVTAHTHRDGGDGPGMWSLHRRMMFDRAATVLVGAGQPTLLVLDDAQWADPDTLAFLPHLVQWAHGAPLLLLLTVRQEHLPELSGTVADLQRSGVLVEVSLGPLDLSAVAQLARHLVGGLDAATVAALHAHTHGDPLYVCELLRAGWPDIGGIPERLHAVIAARFSELSAAARGVLDTIAVLGTAAEREMLSTLHPDATLDTVLAELWARRLIRIGVDDRVDLAHDEMRTVAYQALDPATRRALHRRIAEAVRRSASPELLAHHLRDADAPLAAVAAYEEAARRALDVFATDSAALLLQAALDQLGRIPPSPDRDERELALRTMLGRCLVSLEGYGSARTADTYQHALSAARRLRRPPPAPILRGLALAAIARAELPRAARLAAQLTARTADHLAAVEGEYVLGVTRFWEGAFPAAARHLTTALSRYDPSATAAHVASFAQDPRVICLVRLAYCRWFQGATQEAVEFCDQALAWAETVGDPTSLGYALHFASWLAQEREDASAVAAWLAAGRPVWEGSHLGFFAPTAAVLEAWLQLHGGDPAGGVGRLVAAVEEYTRSGQWLHRLHSERLLAEGLLAQGQPDHALAVLHTATARRGAQRYLDAELLRLQAVAERQLGHPQAIRTVCRAADVAREQGARSLELRALTTATGWGQPVADRLREVLTAVGPGPDHERARRALAEPR